MMHSRENESGMPRGQKNQRLNIFLMKDGTERASVVRDGVEALASLPIAGDFDFAGEIYTKGTPPNPPRWRQFVQSGTQQRLGVLLNQSASCLIVITAANRVFGIAFGFGRHWIDDRHIVRRFGMIVTLNTVHPDRIRSVDREEFEIIQRKTRSQTSVSSSMENFGLNIQRDLVRSVTGHPQDEGFARHVTGADNLIINVPITFNQLGLKCAQALENYHRDDYRVRYAWIDNFTRITDPTQIAALDQALVETLRSGAPGNAFLTPPDTLDTQENRGFRYPKQRQSTPPFPDMRIDDFFSRIALTEITLEGLKKWRIREYTSDDEHVAREYSIYDAIIYEVAIDEKMFVLSLGEWFEIARDHVAAVNREIGQIPDHVALTLIDAQEGESETEYNTRAAMHSSGSLALLDRRIVQYGGGRSSIEICDLLARDRNFIHVKPKTKSSTLSHLFAQGLNSAQAFRNVEFRQLARAVCPESHQSLFEGEPRVSDYTVTFAVITHADGDLREAFPFFSKQSLANAARELSNMGYRVRLKKICVGNNGV
jgi:uncharacterized protein (TIGR04141 family)